MRHLVRGPLHALGAADIAVDTASTRPFAFRLTKSFYAMWTEAPSPTADDVPGKGSLQPDGTLIVPRRTDGASAMIARFCSWLALTPDTYAYRLTRARSNPRLVRD